MSRTEWQDVRDTAMWYVEKKKSEHRFDGQVAFDMKKAATYDAIERKRPYVEVSLLLEFNFGGVCHVLNFSMPPIQRFKKAFIATILLSSTATSTVSLDV